MEQELADAWAYVRQTSTVRVLKIVHGYGSSGRGGTTRTLVRNWAFEHRAHWRAVIEGERYTHLDADTMALRQSVGQYPDPDLQNGNPGILILWIR